MAATESTVQQTFTLGPQWPTLDPFLFCAHHLDAYPAADGRLGPAAPLAGRQIGSDFAGRDGWNMYHGSKVPGFPSHPHRGFETISYVRSGYMDHADSLGAAARFGQGDVQWMTAGAGIVHSEMFPLFDTGGPNPLEMFQIWLNLPADDKMVPPHFSMLWSHQVPKHIVGRSEITVIAGDFDEVVAPQAPPHSWANRADSDVAIWHLSLGPDSEVTLPAGAEGSARTIYVFARGGASYGGSDVPLGYGAVVGCDHPVPVSAGSEGSEVIVLQGRPIAEPMARYGPFVMNDEAEIRQAMVDYQQTGFGGWPWPASDPVHGDEPKRFARHADGRLEELPA